VSATTELLVEAHHNGPPNSAHGGVTVGRMAELLGRDPAEVRLLAPPPLEVPMALGAGDREGSLVATGPGGDVAVAWPLDDPVVVEGFSPAPPEEVEEAAARYLERVTGDGHAFPTCFGCGHERGEDALRQFTSVASDRDSLARFHRPGDGGLPDWLTIAGLDCPSGWTVFTVASPAPAAAVLASMQCQVHETTVAGVDYQVRGRLQSSDGRKHFSEVAMLDPDGATVAAARTLWIEVDPADFGN
jgi:hypothetical protein